MAGRTSSPPWFWAVCVALLSLTSVVLSAPLASAHPGPRSPDTAGGLSEVRASIGARPQVARFDAGEGSVLSTLDLVDGRVLPGATQPASQDLPMTILYDPVNGDLYVRGNSGSSITVIDGATNSVIQEIPVAASQNGYITVPSMAVDPWNGTVYTANQPGNVSVINGTLNRVTTSINTGGSSSALAFDSKNRYLYVPLWYLAEVAVVNTTTDTVTANVPVGRNPGAILYDAASDQVFVANYGSQNVSVIDAATQKVTSNIVIGSAPMSLALDTADDFVDVGDLSTISPHVTVIPAAHPSTAQNISVGDEPTALAYDPIGDKLFVTNSEISSDSVSVIDQSTGTVVATRAVGVAPQSIAYDPGSGDVYVFNAESYNVTILNGTTNDVIGEVGTNNSYGYGLAVDAANAEVFAVSEGSYTTPGSPPHAQANATVISGRTNRAIASVPLEVLPYSVTFDPQDGALLVVDRGGNDTYVVDPATLAIERVVPLGMLPQAAAVDSLNGEVGFIEFNQSFPYNGSVELLSAGLAPIKNLTAGFSPTGIAFDSSNGCFYVTDDVTGNVTAVNGTQNKIVASFHLGPSADLMSIAYDPHSNNLYVGDGSNDSVAVIAPSTGAVIRWIGAGLEPASIAVDPKNDTVFVANEGSGNLTVISDTTNARVATVTLSYAAALSYDSANNLIYNAAAFAGIVDAVNASTYASAGALLSLGTTLYPHAVGYDPVDQDIYVTSLYQGSVSVIGAAAPTYRVNFTETGLPPGTPWTVTLNGVVNSSSGATIGFRASNGTLPFAIGQVTGYTASPASGNVAVAGANVSQPVAFSPAVSTPSYAVTFFEDGLPAGTEWTVTLTGATPVSDGNPYHNFTDPNGSYSYSIGNVTGYNATPSKGTVVVDGKSVEVTVTFTPGPAPTSSGGGTTSAPPWWIWVIIAAAALIIILLVARRRRKKPAAAASISPPPAPSNLPAAPELPPPPELPPAPTLPSGGPPGTGG